MTTTRELLDATNDAILKVTSGALRYQNPVDGSMVEYPSLSELQKSKRELTEQLAAENNGATYMGAAFGTAGERGCL